MELLTQWRTVLQQTPVPLAEGALVIAAHARPDLDLVAQLARLDDLAAAVDEPTAAGVSRLLFGQLGLRGNVEAYDDPRNSFLDQVLDRRLGIPISLSVLLIEVGRRCGVPLEGVGTPGHFMVRDLGDPDALIDAFAGGRRLDRAACRAFFARFDPALGDVDPTAFAGADPAAVLARMLANLDRAYEDRDDRRSLLWVSRLRAVIPDRPLGEQAEVAGRLADLGALDEAADLWDTLAATPGLDDEPATRLRHRALSVRALLN